MDTIITTHSTMYLFEIKYGVNANEALSQIEDRKYYERFLGQGKKIVLIGLSFNPIKQKLTLECASKTIEA